MVIDMFLLMLFVGNVVCNLRVVECMFSKPHSNKKKTNPTTAERTVKSSMGSLSLVCMLELILWNWEEIVLNYTYKINERESLSLLVLVLYWRDIFSFTGNQFFVLSCSLLFPIFACYVRTKRSFSFQSTFDSKTVLGLAPNTSHTLIVAVIACHRYSLSVSVSPFSIMKVSISLRYRCP